MSNKNQTLGEFIIENQDSFKYTSGELSRLINSIRLAAKVVNHEVNKAGLVDITGAAGDTNIQGEDQQKLDVYANEKFIQSLTKRNIVCGIASEEEDDFVLNLGIRLQGVLTNSEPTVIKSKKETLINKDPELIKRGWLRLFVLPNGKR